MRDFLWGDTRNLKKFHTVAWESICLPREEGGLSIRRVKEWSLAGLTMNLWAIANGKTYGLNGFMKIISYQGRRSGVFPLKLMILGFDVGY